MANTHATAIVAPSAELGEGVEIGPFSVVGSNVKIGSGTKIMAHVFIDGHTSIGSDCTIYPFASLGTRTQDLKYRGGTTRVEIGHRTTIREYVTVNSATDDGDCTSVGSDCLIMAYAHIAHDCIIGNEVIIANCGTLAGHIVVEDQVVIGGLSGVHQFVRLGRLSIVGGCSKVTQDVPPFMMADGHPLAVRGINSVGLKRGGFDESAQRQLKQAYRILYRRHMTLSDAASAIQGELTLTSEIKHLLDFVAGSERGITR